MKTRICCLIALAGILGFALCSCNLYRTAKRAVAGDEPPRAVVRPTNEYDILRLRIMERMAGPTPEQGGAQ
jgi:hypothetical protein